MHQEDVLLEMIYKQLPLLVSTHGESLGINQYQSGSVRLLGRGESYFNFLVTINSQQQFNLRVWHRNNSDEQVIKEFKLLQRIESPIAPKVWACDTSMKILPNPYFILEYLEGSEVSELSVSQVSELGRLLASLHQQRADSGQTPEGLEHSPIDFVKLFTNGMGYWKKHESRIFELPVVKKLWPQISSYISNVSHFINERSGSSLVHGDVHKFNILNTNNGLKLIDWEMAHSGDPALDLSKLIWPIETHWQWADASNALQRLIGSYQNNCEDPTMPQRVDAWQVYTMFFDQLYHRTQIDESLDYCPNKFTVEQIEAYLFARFC